MRLQILGKDIPSNTMKILMTFFAHIRIIVLSDVLNLMFLKGVLSIFLLPLPRKFTTYWRTSIKKATGYDNVPATIIKMAADEFASPLTNLINLSIERSCFPSDLKKSELSPLYKCRDWLVSGNYRPPSILPSVSKTLKDIQSAIIRIF